MIRLMETAPYYLADLSLLLLQHTVNGLDKFTLNGPKLTFVLVRFVSCFLELSETACYTVAEVEFFAHLRNASLCESIVQIFISVV